MRSRACRPFAYAVPGKLIGSATNALPRIALSASRRVNSSPDARSKIAPDSDSIASIFRSAVTGPWPFASHFASRLSLRRAYA